ncbi:hypothetical protein NX059_010664 [Plenodomus lindquistii]|nr:hypothetical protein NX059_010664 [Plenodomus lindquistii]
MSSRTVSPVSSESLGSREPIMDTSCASDRMEIASVRPYNATHIQEHLDTAERVNRKMDVALLPFLSLLYLFNGLDRSNIGNAETQGFSADIKATPDDLNLAVSLFFIPFVLLQPLSAAIGQWIGAKYWISAMMLGWGLFTIAHAYIQGRSALIAVRLMLGAFEAGFYPTAIAYLSAFYSRYDLATRIALFYGQYAVAGAFSGCMG